MNVNLLNKLTLLAFLLWAKRVFYIYGTFAHRSEFTSVHPLTMLYSVSFPTLTGATKQHGK